MCRKQARSGMRPGNPERSATAKNFNRQQESGAAEGDRPCPNSVYSRRTHVLPKETCFGLVADGMRIDVLDFRRKAP
jgi:hypothetical protein